MDLRQWKIRINIMTGTTNQSETLVGLTSHPRVIVAQGAYTL